MKFFLAKIILLVCAGIALGQSEPNLPLPFHQFFNSYSLLNPASIGRQGKVEFYISDKANMGAFAGVNKFDAYGNYRLNKERTDKPKHVAGLSFSNEKTGPYIGRSRLYASYAVHIPIRHDLTLNAGASVGMVNYYYHASQLFPGNSSWAPSSDIGLWLYNRNFNAGLSLNQLLSGTLRPFNQELKLNRYLNLNTDKTFQVHPQYTVTPMLWVQWINKDYYYATLAVKGIYEGLFSGGVAYKYQKGYTVFLGVEKIEFNSFDVRWALSYYNRVKGTNFIEVPSIEMSLFFLSKNKSEE